jgi:hypothetical protein
MSFGIDPQGGLVAVDRSPQVFVTVAGRKIRIRESQVVLCVSPFLGEVRFGVDAQGCLAAGDRSPRILA